MSTEWTSNSTTEPEEYPVTEEEFERCPVHPGEVLREVLGEGMGLSVAEAARRLRVSRQTLHRVLAGAQAVTPEMALRLGKLCGNGPELWLRMQMMHDLRRLERAMGEELERIPTVRAAA